MDNKKQGKRLVDIAGNPVPNPGEVLTEEEYTAAGMNEVVGAFVNGSYKLPMKTDDGLRYEVLGPDSWAETFVLYTQAPYQPLCIINDGKALVNLDVNVPACPLDCLLPQLKDKCWFGVSFRRLAENIGEDPDSQRRLVGAIYTGQLGLVSSQAEQTWDEQFVQDARFPKGGRTRLQYHYQPPMPLFGHQTWGKPYRQFWPFNVLECPVVPDELEEKLDAQGLDLQIWWALGIAPKLKD